MAEEKTEDKRTITIHLPKLNLWMFVSVVLGLVLVLSFVGVIPFGTTGRFVATISPNEAANKAIEYLRGMGYDCSLVSVKEFENPNLYEVITSLQGRNIPVYVTKDGRFLFSLIADTSQEITTTTTQPQEIPKSDKPTVGLYIFSYCPAGTAALDSYATVGKLLSSKADMRVKFFSNMHGDHELQQNKIQECIQANEPSKYWDYASNYVEEVYNKCGATKDVDCDKNESIALMQKIGVDSEKIMNCVKENGETLYSNDKNDASRFNLQYSPSLVINDVSLGSNFDRSSEGIKNLICSAFTTAPAECSQTLSSSSGSTSGGCA